MKDLYGTDMEKTQHSKLLSDIPDPDFAISMGCNVGCPVMGRGFDDNWELEDPTGKAAAYFKNGFNCLQAVFATFATELGMSEEVALKVATQFGGGARKGEMYGAVSGALMVLGLKYGHCHAGNMDEKKNVYKISEDFMDRFIERQGTC